MPARTRCSPAVSLYPSLSVSRPSFSCTAARADHALHQSSQRSILPVTSSKSASSTPLETKRGAQCEIADWTRASLAILSPGKAPGREAGGADYQYESAAGEDARIAAVHHSSGTLERLVAGRALEEDFVGARTGRCVVLELRHPARAAARHRRKLGHLEDLRELRGLEPVRPHRLAGPCALLAESPIHLVFGDDVHAQYALLVRRRALRGGLAIGKER